MHGYNILKALLDPVVIVLIILSSGVIIARRLNHDKSNYVIIIVCVLLYAMSVSPISNSLCYYLEKEYYLNQEYFNKKTDVVVVLAGGVISNTLLGKEVLNRQTATRLLHAIHVFKVTHADYFVCSGTSETFNESETMCRTAQELGIPSSMIKIDMNSRNTREHAIEMGRMFIDRDITIALVTSAYHMKRSETEFKKYFHNVIPYPTDYLYSNKVTSIYYLLPSASNLNKLSIVASEIIGIYWYKIRNISLFISTADIDVRAKRTSNTC